MSAEAKFNKFIKFLKSIKSADLWQELAVFVCIVLYLILSFPFRHPWITLIVTIFIMLTGHAAYNHNW